MKLVLRLILLFAVPAIVLAQLNWNYQNPKPTPYDLKDVCTLDAQTLVAVGLKGTIIKSTDGGENWFSLPSGATDDFKAVHFANSTAGAVIGGTFYSPSVRTTTNGGASWSGKSLGTMVWDNLVDVYTVDATHIYLLGSNFYKTSNGGTNWTTSAVNGNAFYFTDANNGIVVANSGVIKKTTDGGGTWTTPSSGTSSHLNSVYFTSPSVGYISGSYSGIILKTTDGGETWTQKYSGDLYNYCLLIAFADANRGIVSGNQNTTNAKYLQTTDAGENWTDITSQSNYIFSGVTFANSTIGIAVKGNGAVYKSTDGGGTWTQKNTVVTTKNLVGVHYADLNNGTAVGSDINGGVVVHTTNGGNTWILQTTQMATPNNVFFLNPEYGAVAYGWSGGGGGIFTTRDAGNTWTRKKGNGQYDLDTYGISMLDTGTIVATASQGKVYRSTNSGTNWSTIQTPVTATLYNLQFIQDTIGVAVGASGAIIRTTDGGLTWTQQTSNTTTVLYGVSFCSLDTGTVVGGSGKIYRTVDGGATWTLQSSGVSSTLRGVAMIDGSTGYISGDAGVLLTTTNGGTTWTKQVFGTANLSAMWFNDAAIGTIVGSSGLIMSTRAIPTSVREELTPTLPTAFSLLQNYPNPFNPTTSITYRLAKEGFVHLQIFDLLGREVASLVSENQHAGTYTATWDATNVGGGMYFYRLSTESFSQVKKLVLLK